MNLLTAYRLAQQQFDRRMLRITPGQWDNSTPCAEWSVRDLVRHVVWEEQWVPDVMARRTIAEVGAAHDGEVLGDDPLAAWTAASQVAAAAVNADGALDGAVHLSYGDAPATEYLAQRVLDVTVHAWDLASGINADTAMPNDLAATVLQIAADRKAMLAASGLFAAALPVTACTDDLDELLAITGRTPWQRFTPVRLNAETRPSTLSERRPSSPPPSS